MCSYFHHIYLRRWKNIKEELMRKSGMSHHDFGCLLRLILEKVKIVDHVILETYKEKAVNIVKNLDLDDVTFVACALAYPGSFIWSDDKKLKEQSDVRVLNTSEILKFLTKKS